MSAAIPSSPSAPPAPSSASLLLALENKSEVIACKLLLSGANPNSVGPFGITALHLAIEQKNLSLTRFLIDKKADVHAATFSGKTPLHIACKCAKSDAVHDLLEAGAIVDALDRKGRTPLHLVASHGKKTSIFSVCSDPLSIASHQIDSHENPLSYCHHNARELLEAGACVDSVDADGRTPLYYATLVGDEYMVDILLSAKADPNAPICTLSPSSESSSSSSQ